VLTASVRRRWLIGFAAVVLLAGCGKSKDGSDDKKDGDKDGPDFRILGQGAYDVNNLKQIGIALHSHHDQFGYFPSAGPEAAPAQENLDPRKTPWRVALLPFLEENLLYKAILAGQYKGGNSGGEYWLNPELQKTPVKVYNAGGDAEATRTHYRVFVGNGAAFEPNLTLAVASFTDGLSNTILVVESEESVPWMSTQELPYDPKKPLPKLGHPSRSGFYALMGDGSVRYIPKNTDEKLIRAMITRAGGEVIDKLPGEQR
jgi:hypothetical protein